MPFSNVLKRIVALGPSRDVVLYTRAGCHLCDDAKAILEKYRASHSLVIREVDIDRDPALKERYDCCVPVVEFDGVVRFRGKVNEVLLKKLLR
jgi:glutaredoxin